MKKINPFETAYEQYRELSKKVQTTYEISEKNLLFRRRINLLSVMEFLINKEELPH